MEVVRNTEPWCCCRWLRGEGESRGETRVLFFYGGKIVLQLLLLLLCEYCQDKAVKCISAV